MVRVESTQDLDQVELGYIAPEGTLPEYFVAATGPDAAEQSRPSAEASLPLVPPLVLAGGQALASGGGLLGVQGVLLTPVAGRDGIPGFLASAAPAPAIAARQVTLPDAAAQSLHNSAVSAARVTVATPVPTLGGDANGGPLTRNRQFAGSAAHFEVDIERIRREALALFEKAAPVWLSGSPHGYLVAELREAIVRAEPATLRRFAERAGTETQSTR